MTRFDPSLQLTRFVVERNGKAVYDEAFHAGVNIIRGDNSSGKSTILNLIFYALGGDLNDWSDAALLCTDVYAEVIVNGSLATLKRDISDGSRQPMEIFGGDFVSAKSAPIDDWNRYPYSRSTSKESFSQALFRLLGLPEVANESTGNLTINQIFRLLYADQLSPVEALFKHEGRFDQPSIREAVGRLLCGAFEPDLYSNEQKIRSLEKEFEHASGELRSLLIVLSKAGQSLTADWINSQRAVLSDREGALQKVISTLEEQVFNLSTVDELTLTGQNLAYKTVQTLQEEIGKIKNERDRLAFNIADSALFIGSLNRKIEALKESTLIVDEVGDVQFGTCPACFSTIESDGLAHACHLCKTPFDFERSRGRIVALMNDTAIQLKQSELLQKMREEDIEALTPQIQILEEKWRTASRRLESLTRLPSSELQDQLRDLHRQEGYLERELEDLEEKAILVDRVSALGEIKENLNKEITRLKNSNEAMRAAQIERLADAHTAIADEIRLLLRNDLPRQDAFREAKDIEFGFGSNNIGVNGQTYFSASSRVVLKSSFFLGFLAAATKKNYFRHPRFCIIDTIEDKGMEVKRSHNFQMQIARVSKESKVEHQIIFATTMIAPDLEDEEFTIGKFSTPESPTLAIQH